MATEITRHPAMQAWRHKQRVRREALVTPNLMRIWELPAVDHLTGGPEGGWTERLRLPEGEFTLRPIQEAALNAIHDSNGLLGGIAVGHGKSFIVALAGTVLKRKRALAFAPASTCIQLRSMIKLCAQHFNVACEVAVVSYALLSSPTGSQQISALLGNIAPEDLVLVCDEAHYIRYMTSARTKRFMRLFDYYPGVACVMLSGTLTNRRPVEYSHLSYMALRANSPVPADSEEERALAYCVGMLDGDPPSLAPQYLRVLQAAHEKRDFRDGMLRDVSMCRDGYRRRLTTAPGVVFSPGDQLGTSLSLGRFNVVMSAEAADEIARLRDSKSDRDGIPFVTPLAEWRANREASAGYGYEWDWPGGKVDWEWMAARKDWHAELAKELLYRHEPGYDSPALVAKQLDWLLASGRTPSTLLEKAYFAWLPESEKPWPPPTIVAWRDCFLAQAALDYAQSSSEPVVFWYTSKALGDMLRELGMPCYDEPGQLPLRPHHCAASIRVYGTGIDGMQKVWSTGVVLEPPTTGSRWEQLLGRLHRVGTEADTVTWLIANHTPVFKGGIAQAVVDARYQQETTGVAQRLLYADWDDDLGVSLAERLGAQTIEENPRTVRG